MQTLASQSINSSRTHPPVINVHSKSPTIINNTTKPMEIALHAASTSMLINNDLEISFRRNVRGLDGAEDFGAFPLMKVADFADELPAAVVAKNGILIALNRTYMYPPLPHPGLAYKVPHSLSYKQISLTAAEFETTRPHFTTRRKHKHMYKVKILVDGTNALPAATPEPFILVPRLAYPTATLTQFNTKGTSLNDRATNLYIESRPTHPTPTPDPQKSS
jgi:hypothetical protein